MNTSLLPKLIKVTLHSKMCFAYCELAWISGRFDMSRLKTKSMFLPIECEDTFCAPQINQT